MSRFYWILELKECLAIIYNLSKHYGAEPPEARGPMQLHRLHRLEAGPALGHPVNVGKDIGEPNYLDEI